MMKRRLPTWLVVLLVAMLPMRGALAAVGMFCHAGTGSEAASAMAKSEVEHASHHHTDDDVASPSHHHGNAAEADDPARTLPTAFSCSYCAMVCGAPAVPADEVEFSLIPVDTSQRFPALTAPRVVALTGGVERPPRTI
jgi:hypothetical protein